MHPRFNPPGSHARVEDLETLDRRAPVVVHSSTKSTGPESTMPVCPECGGAVTAADAFCAQCGSRVTNTTTSGSASSVSDPPAGNPAGSPGSKPPAGPSISMAMPQWGHVTRKGWWLLGGVLLVFIGSLLPWDQESVGGYSGISAHPGGGGVVVFLLLAISTVAAARPLLTGALSKRRLVPTTVVVAILTLLAMTNWSDLHQVQQQAAGGPAGGYVTVSAGSGLVLYTVGVVVLCILVVRLWLSRRSAAPAAR